ncbi:MAG: hypothetical protein AAF600_10365 [Bacteroidota bacterium]
MKKFTQNLLKLITTTLLIFTSCGVNDDIEEIIVDLTDPGIEDRFDARLNNNSTDSLNSTVFLSDIEDDTINVLLSFISSDDNMNRVYITRDIQGQGAEAIDASDEFGVNDKGDGSIDLSGDLRREFNFEFTFHTAGLSDLDGTIVYTFWATSKKGDFRDVNDDLLVGPAILTIDLSGTNPTKILNEYTDMIKLEAPLADGSSETFISTLDGQVYEINRGEEFASFWDFGFYYLGNTGISLASTVAYPELFRDPDVDTVVLVTVNQFLDIEATEVNDCFFQLAPDGTDFDSFSTANDLTFDISENDEQDINELEVGDIVYILDQYGKKGVLKITDLIESFGSDGFVEFEMKVER